MAQDAFKVGATPTATAVFDAQCELGADIAFAAMMAPWELLTNPWGIFRKPRVSRSPVEPEFDVPVEDIAKAS